MLEDAEELALLDVREEGVFSRSHMLFAVPLPLSRLEERLSLLVPRRGTRIVLCDDDDGLAERAAARMHAFGYTDVRALRGGGGCAGVAVLRALREFARRLRRYHPDRPRGISCEIIVARPATSTSEKIPRWRPG